jgi:Ca2+-binding RTX toxin-like protein
MAFGDLAQTKDAAKLTSVESFKLNGNASDNSFSFDEVVPRGSVSGGGGSDDFQYANKLSGTIKLTNTSLTGGGAQLTLTGVESASLQALAGSGRTTFDVSAKTTGGRLTGSTAALFKVYAAANVNYTLSNGLLVRSGRAPIALVRIGRAELLGGNGNNTIDASAFTAGPLLLRGGAGTDTLRGGSQGDSLYGETGDDFLFGNGSSDLLDGGAGRDTGNGGPGSDRGVSVEKRTSIEVVAQLTQQDQLLRKRRRGS